MSTYIPLNRSLLFSALLAIAAFTLMSCGGKEPIIIDQAALSADVPNGEVTKESDKQFMLRAADILYEEILLGKLAQTRAGTEEVKTLARELENASRESKMKLGSLGIIKSIPVPSVPTPIAQAAYDTLNKQPIEEFEYVYIRQAVERHQKAISHFEGAERGNIDPDVKAYASATLPVLRGQLTKTMELDARLNPISEVIR